MPLKSKAQLRWMAHAEEAGEVPKGTFSRWRKHTKNIKSLPEKVKKAYDLGVQDALEKLGVDLNIKPDGKETRLRLDHEPKKFYNVNRTFERSNPHKKETGTHEDLKDPPDRR